MILYEKVEQLFDDKGEYRKNLQKEGTCSVCGKEKTPTTSNTTNLQFKFYITDKIGFSSNLDGQFTKNYSICKDCYRRIMTAESYINKKLKTRIGEFDVYVIPHILFKTEDLNIDDFSEELVSATASIADIASSLRRAERKITDEHYYLINYLFITI